MIFSDLATLCRLPSPGPAWSPRWAEVARWAHSGRPETTADGVDRLGSGSVWRFWSGFWDGSMVFCLILGGFRWLAGACWVFACPSLALGLFTCKASLGSCLQGWSCLQVFGGPPRNGSRHWSLPRTAQPLGPFKFFPVGTPHGGKTPALGVPDLRSSLSGLEESLWGRRS